MFYPSQGIKKEPFFMAQHYQFIRKQITCQWLHEKFVILHSYYIKNFV